MRKLALLLVLLLLAATSAQAQDPAAQTHTIRMSGADVTFAVPEGMLCLTGESSASEFSQWGMSQRDFFAYMEEYDVYALLYDLNTGDSYQISVYPYLYKDYDKLTDAEALETMDGLKAEMVLGGLEVLKAEWYRSSSCAYAVLELSHVYEDGYVEQSSQYFTNQAEYCVAIVAFPYGEELTDSLRSNVRLLADSLSVTAVQAYMPAEKFVVKTGARQDGSVFFTMPGVRMSIVPLDARYVVTRESSRSAFDRMGYHQKKTLADMEEYGVYAILMDDAWQTVIYVYLHGVPNAADYHAMDDVELYESERLSFLEYDWTVEQLTIFPCESAKFTRAVVSYTEADGEVDRRMVYNTRINGCEVSIQAFPQEPQALEACAEALDAFVRSVKLEILTQ